VRSFLLLVSLLLATALPARATILTQANLEALVKISPQLAIKPIGGRPYVSVKGDGDALGYLDAAALDYGYQIDKTDVLIVPLVSGGSGGVFTTLIFSTISRQPSYVGKIDSHGHLDVHLSHGVIDAVTPTYGPNDPQARPSGHHTDRYAVHAGKLVKVDGFEN
jgi:hypothetical protein